jgi:hypothetical protein
MADNAKSLGVGRLVAWASVAELEAQARHDSAENGRRHAEWLARELAEKLERIHQTRQAAALLDAAGVDLYLPDYHSGARLTLDLGFFKRTRAGNAALAAALGVIRRALGCRLERAGKDVHSAQENTVEITMRPSLFPAVKLKFQRRVNKHDRCKIVRSRSTFASLVCEA